jgi:hypothetical protein
LVYKAEPSLNSKVLFKISNSFLVKFQKVIQKEKEIKIEIWKEIKERKTNLTI